MEKIPNLHKIRQIMYPEPEIYTLQDMMEDDSIESPLDDALFQAYRHERSKELITYFDVDEKRRLIELTVDADAVLTIDVIQAHSQKISNIVQELGAGQVKFIGIQGGMDMRVGLVYSF